MQTSIDDRLEIVEGEPCEALRCEAIEININLHGQHEYSHFRVRSPGSVTGLVYQTYQQQMHSRQRCPMR